MRGDLLFLIDVVRERLVYPDLKRAVVDAYRRHGAKVCLIEDAGVGSALVADLRREGVTTKGVRPEGDKIVRMSRETAQLEAGALSVPRSAPWLADLRTELLAFPKGRHDDQVGALSQALAWVRTKKVGKISWHPIRGQF